MTELHPGRSLDLTPRHAHREGAPPPAPVQLALDELGPSLFDVTFVVVDLETTGGRPGLNSITEFGAVKVRGGDVIEEFTSLVNPRVPIPANITMLTGITNSMVALAPDLAEVMAGFLRFVGTEPAVFVAHNARFDISHLKGACSELGYSFPAHPVIDTVRLARKVFTRDETPNYKLATLARVCGAEVQPTHRALDDARATVDLLHAILSRLGGIGVTHLADLMTATDPVPAKRRARAHLADGLPRGTGVYRFIGPGSEVLYVGTSVNVYKRVRQYFTAAERRARMAEMVDLAVSVEATATATQLEASVLEVRLINELDPPYNRRSRRSAQRPWLALTSEPFPRLKVTRKVRFDQLGQALGPFGSAKQASRAVELLQAATGLRECTPRLPATPDGRPACHLHELGKCDAPCLTGAPQEQAVAAVSSALAGNVAPAAAHALAKIRSLAAEARYEQAAGERDRLYALVGGAKSLEELRSLVGNPRIVAARRGRRGFDVVVIDYGMLRASAATRPGEDPEALGAWLDAATEQLPVPELAAHVTADEVRLLSTWLMHEDVQLIKVARPELLTRSLAGGYAVALPLLPQSRAEE